MALYHTYTCGPDLTAIRVALQHAERIATSKAVPIVLYVPGIKNLKNGLIEEAFGRPLVATLTGNQPARFGNAEMRLQTPRRRVPRGPSVTVACHLSIPLINAAIASLPNSDLIVVPWAPEERDEYIASHAGSKQIWP